MIKRFVFFILVTYINIFASYIEINKSTTNINILPMSKIYIDESQQESFELVKKKQFKNTDENQLAFGYSPKLNVWIKITIKNTTDEPIQKLIEYDNALATDVKFYPDDKSNEYTQEGLFNLGKNRHTIRPIFEINLKPQESKVYYIEASSYITTLIVKLKLWDISKFYQYEMEYQNVLIFFFSSMIILAIYNLFIYFIIKDVSYLYYVLYMVSIVIHQFFYTGIANVYISSDIMPNIIKFATLIVGFPALSLALFTKYFLQTSQYKKIDKILTVYIYFFPALVGIFLFVDDLQKLRNIFSMLMIVLLAFITVYATLKKNRQAYFVLFGWIIFFTSALIMYLSSAGIYNFYPDFPYYIEIALVLEALVFSFALADKIRQLEYDKNKARDELIQKEKEQKEQLQEKVDEKTRNLKNALLEIELLLKELNHRVKNNMQMIVSLIRLQSDKIKDKEMREILETIQNRINAMSHLHRMLYSQKGNVNYINTYEYFSTLIDELVLYFNNENIKINYKVQSDIRSEQSVYCGLIINELVSNSFKYAFDGKTNGEVNIDLKKQEHVYYLRVKDNGCGYSPSDIKDSLGLLLVKTLVENQLGGEINTLIDNGVEVNIKWEEEDYES